MFINIVICKKYKKDCTVYCRENVANAASKNPTGFPGKIPQTDTGGRQVCYLSFFLKKPKLWYSSYCMGGTLP